MPGNPVKSRGRGKLKHNLTNKKRGLETVWSTVWLHERCPDRWNVSKPEMEKENVHIDSSGFFN